MNSRCRFLEFLQNQFDIYYPNAKTTLLYETPFQLLVATILSAQSTDAVVNRVTPELFRRFPTPSDLANAHVHYIEEVIFHIGIFRNKARYIKETSRRIVDFYNGDVPTSLSDLLTFPGVARKTAIVVLSTCFSRQEGIAVDTHVKRLSFRFGLTSHVAVAFIERDLMVQFPQEHWGKISHQLIAHGRSLCKARKPSCLLCFLKKKCPKKGVLFHNVHSA